jgi:putative transposase
MLTVVADGCPDHEGRKDRSPSLIDEIVREGARRMLAEALRAEVDAYIAAFAAGRGEDGRRLVVRNRLPPEPGGADQRGRGRGDRAAGQ